MATKSAFTQKRMIETRVGTRYLNEVLDTMTALQSTSEYSDSGDRRRRMQTVTCIDFYLYAHRVFGIQLML